MPNEARVALRAQQPSQRLHLPALVASQKGLPSPHSRLFPGLQLQGAPDADIVSKKAKPVTLLDVELRTTVMHGNRAIHPVNKHWLSPSREDTYMLDAGLPSGRG
eukprot:14029125-Alexandrium_andersonii.AAC.1